MPNAPTDPTKTSDRKTDSDEAATQAPPPGVDRKESRQHLQDAACRFRILRPFARGGLGEVFIAKDEELNREVALKEIQAEFGAKGEHRSRFLLEGEITGGLEHPGIVPVYGMGTYADGRPYYAMRFIRGESLQTALRTFHDQDMPGRDPQERSLALRELLGRFVDVCQAIAYAHSRGVLHRDLKPANVMLGKFGETLVVDWGLAKPIGQPEGASQAPQAENSPDVAAAPTFIGPGPAPMPGAATSSEAYASTERPITPRSSNGALATQMGQTLGTPAYMSPEQAAGRLDLLTAASDIYSLGATLYHVLTGRPPFADPDLAMLIVQVQLGEFPPARAVKPAVPRALEAVCAKALALKPGDRYPSALDLAKEIERWLADEPVLAYREPARARAGRWLRRHRVIATTAAVAAVLTIAALGFFLVLTKAAAEREGTLRGQEQLAKNVAIENGQKAVVNEQKAIVNEQKAIVNEKVARRNLYAAHMNIAQQALEHTTPSPRAQSFWTSTDILQTRTTTCAAGSGTTRTVFARETYARLRGVKNARSA